MKTHFPQRDPFSNWKGPTYPTLIEKLIIAEKHLQIIHRACSDTFDACDLYLEICIVQEALRELGYAGELSDPIRVPYQESGPVDSGPLSLD